MLDNRPVIVVSGNGVPLDGSVDRGGVPRGGNHDLGDTNEGRSAC